MPCTLKHFLGYSRCQICYMLHWLNEGESIKRQKGLSQLQKLTKMQEIKKKIKMDPRPSQLPQLYHIFRCDHASLFMAKNEVCFRKRFLDQCVGGPG